MNLGLYKQEIFDGGILVMLVGPPGAGKSTIAENIKNEYMNFEIVCPDKVRKEVTGDANDQSRNVEVFGKVYNKLIELLADGSNVIYDATNCRSTYRHKILDVCKDSFKKVICIVVTTPIGDCLERNRTRYEKTVPEDVIENMYFTLKKHPPTIFEGYDAIFKA